MTHIDSKEYETLPLMGNIIGDIYGSNYCTVELPVCELGQDFAGGNSIKDDSIFL